MPDTKGQKVGSGLILCQQPVHCQAASTSSLHLLRRLRNCCWLNFDVLFDTSEKMATTKTEASRPADQDNKTVPEFLWDLHPLGHATVLLLNFSFRCIVSTRQFINDCENSPSRNIQRV